MFYRITVSIIWFFSRLLFFWTTKGRNNIPNEGGAIIAGKHRSNWDVVFLAVSSRRPLNFMAKKEMFNGRFFTWLLKHLNAFPVERGVADLKAIKAALNVLKSDKVLLLFPEGTRTKDDISTDAKAGVAMFAIRAKVPVIPATIIGKYGVFRRQKIIYGEPIYFDKYYDTKVDTDTLHKLSDDVLTKVFALANDTM